MAEQHVSERACFERWPGYDDQSWQQRFAELDRRYAEQQNKSIEFAKAQFEKRAEVRREAIEECAKVAEAEATAADREITSYDSYGGPELPARRAEVQRRGAARTIAQAIRALDSGGGG